MKCAFCSLMRESANEIAPRQRWYTTAANCSNAEARQSLSLSLAIFLSFSPLLFFSPLPLSRAARPRRSVIHSCPLRFHCISLFSANGVFIAGARASVRNTGRLSRRNIRLLPCTGPRERKSRIAIHVYLRFRAWPSADAIGQAEAYLERDYQCTRRDLFPFIRRARKVRIEIIRGER